MKNLKAQTTILAIIFIALVSVATGYLYLQNRDLKSQLPSKPVAEPLTPATQPTAIPTNETANWKTYTNQELGFSLKYPNVWNKGDVKGTEENIVVLTPVPIGLIGNQVQAVYIQVHNNPKHLTSMEYYDQVLKPSQAGSVCTNPLINTDVPSPLKNLDVTIIEGMCGVLSQGPRMVVTKDNYIVDVSSSFIDKVDNNLIYQILSTFKFVENPSEKTEGSFCGGFAGKLCPSGYECRMEGNYPDASGTCIKK